MLSLIPGFTVALSLSSARLTPVVASATSVAYDITKVKGDDASLKRAAAFFVNGFWVASTTSGDAALNEKGMEQLCRLQTDDMVGRYGDLVGTRRLESSLFLAQDPSSGELAGCVGVEMALVDASCGKVLSRAQGESLFNSELASMSPKERNSYRKMDAYDLTDELVWRSQALTHLFAAPQPALASLSLTVRPAATPAAAVPRIQVRRAARQPRGRAELARQRLGQTPLRARRGGGRRRLGLARDHAAGRGGQFAGEEALCCDGLSGRLQGRGGKCTARAGRQIGGRASQIRGVDARPDGQRVCCARAASRTACRLEKGNSVCRC